MTETGEYPRVRPACVHSERHREYVVMATTTIRSSLSDIPVSWPATGLVEATVTCGSCESRLRVRVFSPARRLRWKLTWFGLAVLGASIATPSIIRLVALDALDEPAALPMLTNLLGFGGIVVGALFFCTDDGVRPTSFWSEPDTVFAVSRRRTGCARRCPGGSQTTCR
ncbi:hypothetical protein [Amycolatopsis sp. MtRt-6]|uniref:hypothetical protein n=1 Tax=Amycolatopsis sp. MtRt-6 TaxID=2792782 RepID=UPI001A8DDBDC|nr:hypothetical protein [Amycolatopsis sp. MtRt-6]